MSDEKWISEYTDRSVEGSADSPKEIAERLNVPLVGGNLDGKRTEGTQKPIGVCSKCGIVLYPMMMYSCPNEGCPTGLGRTVCINVDGTKGIDS